MEHKKGCCNRITFLGVTGDRNLSMERAVVFLEFTLHIHNMFITWAQTLQLPSANEEKICQYLYGPCSHK